MPHAMSGSPTNCMRIARTRSQRSCRRTAFDAFGWPPTMSPMENIMLARYPAASTRTAVREAHGRAR